VQFGFLTQESNYLIGDERHRDTHHISQKEIKMGKKTRPGSGQGGTLAGSFF